MRARRILHLFVVTISLSVAVPAVKAAEVYAVDPDHTSVVFSAGHLGLSFVYGFFRKSKGAYMLDKTNPAASRFRFSIETGSLDTNQAQRDEHLKGADFFDVQRYPEITFESTSCALVKTPEGAIYQVTGDLTMHGVTQRVTLPLRMLGEGKTPFNDFRSGFLGNVTIKRSDFKMDKYPEMVSDAVSLNFSFEGILQDASGNPVRPPQ